MNPKWHIIFGVCFIGIVYLLVPNLSIIGLIIIFLSSILIDVDHYLYYVYKKRDWSLLKSYQWFLRKKKKLDNLTKKQRTKFYTGFAFLHGIEILLLLLLLSTFLSNYFFCIFIGFSFHLILDYLHQLTWYNRLDKVSLIYDFINSKKLKYI